MKRLLHILASITMGLTLTSCSGEKEETVHEMNTNSPLYHNTLFCILRPPESQTSGTVISVTNADFYASPISVANSANGKETRMIASFLGNDGTKDHYSIEIRIPEEASMSKSIAYEGRELIVHSTDEFVMLIRPKL